MNTTTATFLAAIGLAALTALGPSATVEAQDRNCLTRQDIQTQLQTGDIEELATVMARAGIDQRPLSAEVCDLNGVPHYFVNLMDSYGGKQVTLNARKGAQ